jgi:hypothetical protein
VHQQKKTSKRSKSLACNHESSILILAAAVVTQTLQHEKRWIFNFSLLRSLIYLPEKKAVQIHFAKFY